jgi:hypothetical protein
MGQASGGRLQSRPAAGTARRMIRADAIRPKKAHAKGKALPQPPLFQRRGCGPAHTLELPRRRAEKMRSISALRAEFPLAPLNYPNKPIFLRHSSIHVAFEAAFTDLEVRRIRRIWANACRPYPHAIWRPAIRSKPRRCQVSPDPSSMGRRAYCWSRIGPWIPPPQ